MNKFYFKVGSFLFIITGLFSLLGFETPSKVSGWIEPSINYGTDMIVLGLILLVSSFLIKEKKEKYSICPNCKESFNYHELKDGKCKYCEDVDTIDTEKYYKEHPEELES